MLLNVDSTIDVNCFDNIPDVPIGAVESLTTDAGDCDAGDCDAGCIRGLLADIELGFITHSSSDSSSDES
jgi:hypothetical protein